MFIKTAVVIYVTYTLTNSYFLLLPPQCFTLYRSSCHFELKDFILRAWEKYHNQHTLNFVINLTAIAVEVGFEQEDEAFSEGREDDNIFLRKGISTNDVVLLIRPLCIACFEEYRITTGRNFSQQVLDRIATIENAATGEPLGLLKSK